MKKILPMILVLLVLTSSCKETETTLGDVYTFMEGYTPIEQVQADSCSFIVYWKTAVDVESINIYRDGVFISNESSPEQNMDSCDWSYEDITTSGERHYYWIKVVDRGIESAPSNVVSGLVFALSSSSYFHLVSHDTLFTSFDLTVVKFPADSLCVSWDFEDFRSFMERYHKSCRSR